MPLATSARAAFLAATLLLAGACGSEIEPTCSTHDDCPGTALCRDGNCDTTCNVDLDCKPSDSCVSGTCSRVNNECRNSLECAAPGRCRTTFGVSCVGGLCNYPIATQGTACSFAGGGSGYCDSGGVCIGCLSSAQCEDGNACTTNSCDNEVCVVDLASQLGRPCMILVTVFGVCTLSGDTSVCAIPQTKTCVADASCTAFTCDCIDSTCAASMCSNGDCSCRFDSGGDGICDGSLPAGTDPLDDCPGPVICSDMSSGGPYFYGIEDITSDGVDNPQCYYHADVADWTCDGSGICSSRQAECLATPRGGVAAGRAPCTMPLGGCVDWFVPTYAAVPTLEDPYDDCTGTDVCDGVGGCMPN